MNPFAYLWTALCYITIGPFVGRGRRELIREDFGAFCRWIGIESNRHNFFRMLVTHPELYSVVAYRLPRRFRGVVSLGIKSAPACYLNTTRIGGGLMLLHGFSTIVAARAIGRNAIICQQVTVGYSKGAKPLIGDNCTICCGAKVLGDISIGNNVTVAAGAVVVADVPDNAVVAGNPARIIGSNTGRRSCYPLV